MRLVVEWIGELLVLALVREALIPFAHLMVSNQRRDLLSGQGREVGFGVVAGIGRDQRVRGPQ